MVWTERRLTWLTAGESADRVWFSLLDKTYAPANLASAFHQVWHHGGSAGADAQTVGHLAQHAAEELSRLAVQLRDGTYAPQPVRRVGIPRATAVTSYARWAFRRCVITLCQTRCGRF